MKRFGSEQSTQFAKLYRNAGVPAELVLIQKAPHAFWNYAPWFEDTMNRAGTFFHHVADQLAESQFSRSDFQKLRWLEGRWRGSEGGENAFYERYHFVNDTTIEIGYFANDSNSVKRPLTQLCFSVRVSGQLRSGENKCE